MENLTITTTQFDFELHYTEKSGNSNQGFYLFHSATCYNEIIINDEYSLYAQYETGDIDYSYDSPSNKFSLNEEYSDPILVILNDLCDIDFDNLDSDNLLETLEEIKEICPIINTTYKMRDLYLQLCDNNPGHINRFIDEDDYNINDYNDE